MSDEAIKNAWDGFMAATEVQPSCQAYAALRASCGISEDIKRLSSFRAIAEKTNTAPGEAGRRSFAHDAEQKWSRVSVFKTPPSAA